MRYEQKESTFVSHISSKWIKGWSSSSPSEKLGSPMTFIIMLRYKKVPWSFELTKSREFQFRNWRVDPHKNIKTQLDLTFKSSHHLPAGWGMNHVQERGVRGAVLLASLLPWHFYSFPYLLSMVSSPLTGRHWERKESFCLTGPVIKWWLHLQLHPWDQQV